MAAVRQDVLLGTWYAKRSAESDKAGCLCSRGFQAATVSALLHTKGAFAEILTACRRPQTVRRRLQTCSENIGEMPKDKNDRITGTNTKAASGYKLFSGLGFQG